MAHTLKTLMAYPGTVVAYYAKRLWNAAGGCMEDVVSRDTWTECVNAERAWDYAEHRAAWLALRDYAGRMLATHTRRRHGEEVKCGLIVVNGAACLIRQRGARLTVNLAELGATHACGNGAFRAALA
jgi:hypothetical protein